MKNMWKMEKQCLIKTKKLCEKIVYTSVLLKEE